MPAHRLTAMALCNTGPSPNGDGAVSQHDELVAWPIRCLPAIAHEVGDGGTRICDAGTSADADVAGILAHPLTRMLRALPAQKASARRVVLRHAGRCSILRLCATI